MTVTEWTVIIAAFGTLALQVLGRVQAWQLAVMQQRAKAERELAEALLSQKVDQVKEKVDGNMKDLLNRIAEQRVAISAYQQLSSEAIAALKAAPPNPDRK